MHSGLGKGCTGAYSELIKYWCTGSCAREWIYSAQRNISTVWDTKSEAKEQGSAGAQLTRSLMRSFMPLTVSTMTSGIMLMYHGTDEMAGTHCKRENAHTRTT